MMGFFRRLFGKPEPAPQTNNNSTETVLSGKPPEISLPDVEVAIAPPAPSVEAAQPGATSAIANPVGAARPLAGATRQLPDTVPFGATRQLPPLESLASKPGRHLIYGMSSDVGMVRNNNQDSLYAMLSTNVSADGIPDFGLFVVADGMGGHHDGERASALATRVVADYILRNFYLKLVTVEPDEERPIITEILVDAVQHANDVVSQQIPEGGTTCTVAAVVGDLVYIAHVGDSRAYVVVSDDAEQITRDHSLVQRLIELDQLTPDEAASHPQKNVLYRAIGQSEHVDVDTSTRRLVPGGRLLLCSDGLWNQVSEALIVDTVARSRSPQEACEHLVHLANERGGNDNITVVLIQAPGESVTGAGVPNTSR